jgi:hypothetical protein
LIIMISSVLTFLKESGEIENSFSAHDEDFSVLESEDSATAARRSSDLPGEDARVRRAEAEVLKCRQELQHLNSSKSKLSL